MQPLPLLQSRTFKSDLIASLVVTLIAIPLCLGIALASGAPLLSGLIAGIIGGIIVGFISQSHVSVSGPAAGMVGVVITGITQIGSFEGFLVATMIAGLLQILMGTLRVGFVADYIPANVIQGLLCAIGIVIILKQLPFAFGYFPQTAAVLESLKHSQEDIITQPLLHLLSHINLGATLISLMSISLLILWDKTALSKIKFMPAAVAIVLLSVLTNYLFGMFFPSLYLSNSSHLVSLPTLHSFSNLKDNVTLPNFSLLLSNHHIYIYAIIIAAVASLETLLNLEGAEKIDPHKRYCNRNKELIAQGIGNSLSGLLGGLPITSVIVRTSVNIEAGSQTKTSCILHGFFLLAIMLFIPNIINKIPLSALAAILIYSGYKLSRIRIYKAMYQEGFAHFFPFIVTIVSIIVTNLLNGVLIGLTVSLYYIFKYNSQAGLEKNEELHPEGKMLRLVFPEQASFLKKAAIIAELRAIPENRQVILDARNTDYIDYDILAVIRDFTENLAYQKNIHLKLLGFKSHYEIPPRSDFNHVMTKKVQDNLTPSSVLSLLKAGNQRFINNQLIHRDLTGQVAATSDAQHPFAVILSCIDSRVPVEKVFDVGVGDIFVIRMAGNIVDENVVGSMEYACKIAGAKLIVIMGHKQCGAIKAACDGFVLGHITDIMKKIDPAIKLETITKDNRTSQNESFVNNVTKNNVNLGQEKVFGMSEVINNMLLEKTVGIAKAIYDVKTGVVDFIDA